MLAGEGRSLREQRERAQSIRGFLTDSNIEAVKHARSALREQMPLLAQSTGEEIPEAADLTALLAEPEIVTRVNEVAHASQAIDRAYRTRFAEKHHQRLEAYKQAIGRIKENTDYRALESTEADVSLLPLQRRAVETFEVPPFSAADRKTGATLTILDEDLELLPSLEAGALAKLGQLIDSKRETEEAVEVVRLSDFLPTSQPLTDFSDAEIDEAIEKLKQKLYALRELKRRVLWD